MYKLLVVFVIFFNIITKLKDEGTGDNCKVLISQWILSLPPVIYVVCVWTFQFQTFSRYLKFKLNLPFLTYITGCLQDVWSKHDDFHTNNAVSQHNKYNHALKNTLALGNHKNANQKMDFVGVYRDRNSSRCLHQANYSHGYCSSRQEQWWILVSRYDTVVDDVYRDWNCRGYC